MSRINDLPSTFTRFGLQPYTPVIGAIVHDLDLRRPLDDITQAELRRALAEYEVLFFRQQRLTPDQHVALARVFGHVKDVQAFFPRLDSHPAIEIVESTAQRPSAANNWHADITWRDNPPVATVLHAQVLPAVGGDTLWASMTRAFDSLPPTLQAHLQTLTAVHTWEISRWPEYLLGKAHGEEQVREARAKYPPVKHPVVRVHPVTGRKILYVNPTFTSHIEGLPRIQSDALLNQLFSLITTPEFQARLHWEPDTLAIWDNRSTQHYAAGDYFPQHRKLHRITVTADTSF